MMNNDRFYTDVFKKHQTNATLTCKVARCYPLPTFTWFYQAWKCLDKNVDGSCKQLADNWRSLLPTNKISFEPPLNTPALYSTLKLTADEPSGSAAFYRCQAENRVGKTAKTFGFRRYSKLSFQLLSVLVVYKSSRSNRGKLIFLEAS